MTNSSVVKPLVWREKERFLQVLDQRVLPAEELWHDCKSYQQVAQSIREMWVRGAPAIGIAGAYGMAIAVLDAEAKGKDLVLALEEAGQLLRIARPTAVNLVWAIDLILKEAKGRIKEGLVLDANCVLEWAHQILEDDCQRCRRMGEVGAGLLEDGAKVLTHCNTGALATGDYGTALGVIRSAREKLSMVWVDETRPYFQGSRLTAYELCQEGIEHRLICDNMACYLMGQKEVDAIFIGADRIAANGDTANKIGSYGLAVSAKYHQIPFYVVAPLSTIDLSLESGREIPIEERSSEEVTKVLDRWIAPQKTQAIHPAFDVTSSDLITGIITEKGLLEAPYLASLSQAFSKGERFTLR